MRDHDQLVQLLNRPGAISGTAIGKALGISRMAVQKRIQTLVENGLAIHAVPGKGYTLPEQVALLSEHTIAGYLDRESCDSIEVLQSVPSTNSYLLGQAILTGKAKICVAEAQPSGRGRRGNDWQSTPYRNVMLSMSWGFDHWPETITGLGLAVALTVAETVNAVYGTSLRIKWPNDLMIDTQKLAGILIDVAGESSGSCNVVIGIGLNVDQADWSHENSAYQWTDLKSLGVRPDRNELVGQISRDLISMLQDFGVTGFAPLVERWNSLSSYSGSKVRVGDDTDYLEGQMVSVDSAGALVIVDGDGVQHRFVDSNVSVRLVG